jgi:hypothetical protein
LENNAAIGWRGNSSGNRFGIGQANGGLYLFATASDPGTTGNPPVTSLRIDDTGAVGISGNTVQNRNRGGLMKALLLVNQDGTIGRCYSGVTGADSGGCGFAISIPATGIYDLNFGFFVQDRFLSVTPINNFASGGCYGGSAVPDLPAGNGVRVRTFCTGYANVPFFVQVY